MGEIRNSIVITGGAAVVMLAAISVHLKMGRDKVEALQVMGNGEASGQQIVANENFARVLVNATTGVLRNHGQEKSCPDCLPLSEILRAQGVEIAQQAPNILAADGKKMPPVFKTGVNGLDCKLSKAIYLDPTIRTRFAEYGIVRKEDGKLEVKISN